MNSANFDKKFKIHNFIIDINQPDIPKLVQTLIKNYDSNQIQN